MRCAWESGWQDLGSATHLVWIALLGCHHPEFTDGRADLEVEPFAQSPAELGSAEARICLAASGFS